MTLREALLEARQLLEANGSNEAHLEAELLLMHALRLDRVHLYQRLEDELAPSQNDGFRALLQRRLAHEPLPYITGHREFYGLDLEVTPAVLIPRPETETLVEHAIAFARTLTGPLTIADIGTGSGAIAISLAVALPDARLIATDISADALAVVRRNAGRHAVADRMDFREGDMLEPIPERVQVITANLPYLTTAMWQDEYPEVHGHEPRLALDGGPDGLDQVRRLLADAPTHLTANAALLAEIGEWQGDAAQALARAAFPTARITTHPDLAGRDRVLAMYS